jgi:hypothetical protein
MHSSAWGDTHGLRLGAGGSLPRQAEQSSTRHAYSTRTHGLACPAACASHTRTRTPVAAPLAPGAHTAGNKQRRQKPDGISASRPPESKECPQQPAAQPRGTGRRAVQGSPRKGPPPLAQQGGGRPRSSHTPHPTAPATPLGHAGAGTAYALARIAQTGGADHAAAAAQLSAHRQATPVGDPQQTRTRHRSTLCAQHSTAQHSSLSTRRGGESRHADR